MMLRVLHVLETCGAGGIETTFLNVLTAWRRQAAWAVHDVWAMAGGALAPALAATATRLVVSSDAIDAQRLIATGYDVVHVLFDRPAHQWIPFIAAHSDAALVYGKGYDVAGTFRLNDGVRWQPDESLMWGCDAVTFTTSALASGYSMPSQRRAILGKAADVRRFLALPPVDAHTPDRIVCIANLHALKRLPDLLAAVARLVSRHPDVRVRFVGADDSGEGQRLRQLAAQLGIGDRCEITGRHDDVAADLAAARVFALPSGREGVPTAMLEAMAAARPVVVTDVGHIASVVRDGVEGFLVPVGETGLLEARLHILLSDRGRAATMGDAARRRAAHHDVAVVAARLRETLESAAARVRRGAAA